MFGKHFKLRTSNTDSHNGVIVFSLVEDTKTIGDGDLLLALMDDVTVITIRKSSVEVDVVKVTHCKEALLASTEPKAAILHLPVGLSMAGNSIGKLKNRFSCLKRYFKVSNKKSK